MADINQNDFLNTLYSLAQGVVEIEKGDEIEVSVNGKTLKIKIEKVEDEDPVAAKTETENNKINRAPEIRDLGDVNVAYIDEKYFQSDYDAIRDFCQDHNIDIIIDKKYKGIVDIINDTENGCVEFADIDLQRLERNFGYNQLMMNADELALIYEDEGYMDVVVSVSDEYTIQYNVQENEEPAKMQIKVCKKHRTLKNTTNVNSAADEFEKIFEDESGENDYDGIVHFKNEDENTCLEDIIVTADDDLRIYSFVDGPVELCDERGYAIFKMYKDDVMIEYHLTELIVFDGAPGGPFNVKITDDDYHFEVWEQDDYLLVCVVLDDHQINTEEGE